MQEERKKGMEPKKDAGDSNFGHGTVFGEPIGLLVPMTVEERMRRRCERRGEITRQKNPNQGGGNEFTRVLF